MRDRGQKLSAILANHRPELANAIPDKVGKVLVKLCAEYLGSDAYMRMAMKSIDDSQEGDGVIGDSQPGDPVGGPFGDPVTGPATVQLARRVQALQIELDRVVIEKDRVIQDLQARLATARTDASSSAALAEKRDADVASQKKAADTLRRSERETAERLQRANADLSSKDEVISDKLYNLQ